MCDQCNVMFLTKIPFSLFYSRLSSSSVVVPGGSNSVTTRRCRYSPNINFLSISLMPFSRSTQSFYNYRIREGRTIPRPHQCRGPCQDKHIFTCTYSAYFHLFLAQMGQTALTEQEKNLLRRYDVNNHNQPLPYNLTVLDPPMPNSVFLYEQSQLDGRKFPQVAETPSSQHARTSRRGHQVQRQGRFGVVCDVPS